MANSSVASGKNRVSNNRSANRSWLDNFFKISENGSTVNTEIVAGFTTFMVMAYIIFVNPGILSGVASAQGLTFPAVMAATCLVAGVMTIAMGLYSNYPFALALPTERTEALGALP